MISIYDVNNTEYTKNGNAVLIPTECKLNVQINGSWTLSLTHPYDEEERYKHIIQGAVIRVTDLSCFRELNSVNERTQLFRIYSYQRNINNVTATAYPLAMECYYDTPINSLNAVNKDADEAIEMLQAFTNKYTLTCYVDSDDKTWQIENTNLASALAGDNGFIKVYGGEILYNKLNIEIRRKLGGFSEDTWIPVYYGRNIKGIEYTKDESGVVTRLIPISKDGIKLNGTGYVDSEDHINDYPFIRAKYINAPFNLVDTSSGSDSNTAVLTRSIQSQIQTLAGTLSHSVYNTAITARTYEREYIKQQRDEIIEAVINNCLQNISHEKLYDVMEKAINNGMKWMKDIEKASWSWHQNETGWWYGANDSDYAKNQWCYIDKKWRWFDSDGYWVEKWDDASGDWDWIQSQSNSHWWYGNNHKYYAHDEWIYETVNGELKKYWIDEEGWYREEYTDVSDWTWHAWGDGWWFGEEGATREETSKFAHDQWIWIDGNYYFFDSTGYYDGSNKIDNYDWSWQQDNQWYWFGNTDKSFGAQWLSSQWQKIDNKWYKFDADGYMYEDSALLTACKNMFTTGMTSLKTLCESLKTDAYNLLYSNMTSYCQNKFSDGLDLPNVTINLDIIDLSKTSYYYEGYERMCLGDHVKCVDYEHDISTNERIVGLTYDCIEGYNTNIVVGVAEGTIADKIGVSGGESQPSGGFDTSIIEERIQDNSEDIAELRSSKQDKLTAGTNITIDQNNVISATGGSGGSSVVVNPTGSATSIMKKLKVDDTIYGLPYKELTQDEYDALPDTKLSDDVVYFIKPYTDITVVDNQLIIREFNDGTVIWYFNEYRWIDDGAGDIIISSEIAEKYLPPCPFEPVSPQTSYYVDVTASYYADPTHPELYGEREGWIGFRYNYPTLNDVYVMSYNLSYSSSNNGIFNGRYIMGGSEPTSEHGAEQETEYIPPEEDEYIPRDAKAKIILNGNEYIGGGSGSKSEIVELLQSEYDALSSDKKNNGDLYMVYDEPQLDPDYNYYKWGDNDEIVVRVYHEGESDEEIRWYFHNYSQQATLLPIPSELSEYWSGTNTAKAYTPNTTTVYGWMAISDYQGGVRGIYSTSWSTYQEGPIDAMIVMGDGAEQDTTYSDPYVYLNQNPISRKIYLHEREYTHKVTANPSGTPETNLNRLEVDGTIYSIPSGGGGGGGASYYLHNGLVGASGGSYVTCNLDNMMDAGTYLVTIRDASTNNGLITSYFIEWRNETINLPVAMGTLTITDSTAGLSYYSGNYRDIYCNIIRII